MDYDGDFWTSSGRRRHGLHASWLLYDQSLSGLRSIEEDREEALRLSAARQKLQYGPEGRRAARLKTIERIVPGWFHRNDKNAANNKVVEEKLKEAERALEHRDEPKRKRSEVPRDRHHESAAGNQNELRHKNDKEKTKGQGETDRDVEQRRLFNASLTGNTPVEVRTIHNMHLFRNMSSCPETILPSDVRTTLVLQSTPDRLWILKQSCQRWKDPIVLTVFLLPGESFNAESVIPSETCPQLTIITHKMDASLNEDGRELYPVNRLRNIGLDAVKTSHILMADIDFVPSNDLHLLIHSTLTERQLLREQQGNASELLPSEDRDAIVVPSFERIPPPELCKNERCLPEVQKNLTELAMPRYFEELLSCVVDRKECRVFQSHNNPDGHSSTRSESWLKRKWYEEDVADEQHTDTHSRRIRTLQCFDSVRYEPYVILRWCPSSYDMSPTQGPVAPYYDERFHGYGKNKIEMISHLRVMGYRFSILPEGFIIHAPHSISKAKSAWESTKDSNLHANMDKLYPKFLKEIVAKYKHEQHHIVKPC